MLLNTIINETPKVVAGTVAGTIAGTVLSAPPVQAALINLGLAAVIRLTSWLTKKQKARRAARKAAKENAQ